jgi:hypothetical protein
VVDITGKTYATYLIAVCALFYWARGLFNT